MRAICPTDPRHDRFETTAHVMQSWKVDRTGAFIEALEDLEVTHDPHPDNVWTCIDCGAPATVYRSDGGADADLAARIAQVEADEQLTTLVEQPLEPGVRSRKSELAE